MYFTAHKTKKRTRRHIILKNPGEEVCNREGSLDLPIPLTPPGTHENFRRTSRRPSLSVGMPNRRFSNASFSFLFFHEVGRAFESSPMVTTLYLVCWAPYFVMLAIDTGSRISSGTHTYTMLSNHVSEPVRFFALLTAVSSGSITPFIFCIEMTRFAARL